MIPRDAAVVRYQGSSWLSSLESIHRVSVVSFYALGSLEGGGSVLGRAAQ